MERKLINSVLNGILRNAFDNDFNTLCGIALLLCRHDDYYISRLYSKDEFDYESLFSAGEHAAYQIEKHIPKDQLRLLYEDSALTAETLYEKNNEKGLHIFGGQLTIKDESSQFLFDLLEPISGDTVFNPFGGDFAAPAKNQGIHFVSTYMDSGSMLFAQLVQVSRGLHNTEFSMGGTPFLQYINPDYKEEGLTEYDRIYMPAMPIGIQIVGMKRKAEQTYILSYIKQLRKGGRMVFVAPATALASENYYELRKTLLERGLLRRVVLLGEGFLNDSTAVSLAAFVIENRPSDKGSYYFHDLSAFPSKGVEDGQKLRRRVTANDSEITTIVSYETALSSRRNQLFPPSATPVRINKPGFKYVKLGSLLEPYSNTVTLDGSEMVARLSGKDMHLRLPEYMIDIQDVDITPVKGRLTKITEPVFCFHGITQNYLWCVGEQDSPIYCNSDVYTFRITSDLITPEYLCFVLAQEDVKADIQSRVEKRTIPRINRMSLLEVEIPVPDRDRKVLVKQDLQQYVSDQKTLLSEQEKRSHEADIEDIREDIKDKIHLLGPYNSDVQMGIHRVIKMLERGGRLESDTKVFRDSGVELLGFLKSLLVKSEDAMASIGESIFEDVTRPLDIFTFIQEYVARLQSDDQYEGVTFEITPVKSPVYLMITERSLRLVLDTIVRNAVSHGFPDGFTGDRRIRFTIDSGNGLEHAVISVANNGVPPSEGFNLALYTSKFGKCGPTAHSGRGGYFVFRAMEYYKGYVIVNTADRKWPFDVLLHIPVSHD